LTGLVTPKYIESGLLNRRRRAIRRPVVSPYDEDSLMRGDLTRTGVSVRDFHRGQSWYEQPIAASTGDQPLPNRALRSLRVSEDVTLVLVIDDDPQVRTLVSRLLRHEGYEVVEAGDAGEALRHVDQREPDLVLLDVVMPQVDGIDLLAEIRTRSNVPVIMLTALGDEADRILGLKSGADDYMVKPFSPGELSARIESVLRRSQMSSNSVQGSATEALTFGELEIDQRTRDVKLDGQLVELTAREFDLLFFLASSPRQVFDRQQLLTQVWQSSADWQDPATVTEHVRRIRRKIESDPDRPRWLKTVRGVGYRFEP